MLHTISQPCVSDLNWVMQFQRDLITEVTKPTTYPSTVTIGWVVSLRTDIAAGWLSDFCSRKDKVAGSNRTMLELMKAIAGMSAAKKTRILGAFNNNTGFEVAFDPVNPQPHPLAPISALNDQTAERTVRAFFVSFYDPNMYGGYGYQIPRRPAIKFDRDQYINTFKSTNRTVGVCVLCDGDLGDPDLDHFYSKKVYPELACHPANLIPICKTCNSRARKGEKPPLDEHAPDPMERWLHPIYEPGKVGFH